MPASNSADFTLNYFPVRTLVARKPRKVVVTSDSNHAFPVARNLLDRKYQVENVAALNRAWAGDITSVPTAQGWLYLAVVLDLKSRRVIGWSMRDSLEQTLVHEALEMALGQRLSAEVEGELLFHSDRGSQYAAHDYQVRLLESHIVCSMSRKGNCWDSAVVESFFATLKKRRCIENAISPASRPKPACFITSRSSTIEDEDTLHWATKARTITSNPCLTECLVVELRSN